MEQTQNPAAGDRTFSQDDVNRIVQERLAKEKEKGTADLLKREQDLQARELRMNAREKLTAAGLPVELMEALNCTSEETMEKSITLITDHIKKAAQDAKPLPRLVGVTPGASKPGLMGGGKDDIREAMGLK